MDKRKFRILLDMDDVIIETNKEFASYHFRKHGILFPTGNIDDWAFWPDKSIYIEAFHQEDFLKRIKPKKDAISVIEKWIAEDLMDVFIVTNCLDVKTYEVKLAWMAKNMPFFPIKRLVSLSEKSAMWGDVLVDDAPHNILEWQHNGEPIIYHTSYNLDLNGFKRIRNFNELDQYLQEKYNIRKQIA